MRTLMPLVGIFVLIGGILSLVSFSLLPLYESVQTRAWHPVAARVEYFNVRAHGSGLSWPFPRVEVHYRYEYDGKSYVGTRVNVHRGVERNRDAVDTLSKSLRAGDSITVWIDPRRPDRAIASRTVDWRLIALTLPALALCVVGALMVFFGMLSWNVDRKSLPGLPDA